MYEISNPLNWLTSSVNVALKKQCYTTILCTLLQYAFCYYFSYGCFSKNSVSVLDCIGDKVKEGNIIVFIIILKTSKLLKRVYKRSSM